MSTAGLSEADQRELARLRWRCRRGMRELDRLFERYLEREWGAAPSREREVLLILLDTEDDRLWHWFMGHDTAADAELQSLVERIRQLPP